MMEKLIAETMENLKKNNMDAVYVENKTQLHSQLEQWLEQDASVTFGGSMTLKEAGVYEKLREMSADGKIRLSDRDAKGADVQAIYRKAFSSDYYLTSSNAITKYGYLYNVDGNGNRVAAMIFGPKHVIVIAGINKLVLGKEEAEERVRNIAAPKNAQRLALETPCAATGACMDCMSDARICCSYTFLGKQRVKGRIKVIIVGEEYGY